MKPTVVFSHTSTGCKDQAKPDCQKSKAMPTLVRFLGGSSTAIDIGSTAINILSTAKNGVPHFVHGLSTFYPRFVHGQIGTIYVSQQSS